MHDAHEALICIGNKSYLNDKNRKSYTSEHYLKSHLEMEKIFEDLPEALENNYNLPLDVVLDRRLRIQFYQYKF